MVFLKGDSDYNITTGLPSPKKINIHEREIKEEEGEEEERGREGEKNNTFLMTCRLVIHSSHKPHTGI